MIDEVLEDEQLKQVKASGGHLPMLSCRGIDFSYGQLQVLFDVDFTVDDGEMVALLGTNGAGKSTLLKVISGIGLPSAGNVRYRGQDITYLDAERRDPARHHPDPRRTGRVRPADGDREPARRTATPSARSARTSTRSSTSASSAFPRLGRAPQQLGRPALRVASSRCSACPRPSSCARACCVIDELSLGLAPIIVGQLLDMVRQHQRRPARPSSSSSSRSTSRLNLVEHAYFMEKGEMRFDGPARELLERDDLLRAVFLQGAEAAT